MARYTTPHDPLPEAAEETRGVANPYPLGLGILAFATAVLSAYYAGFIIPFPNTGSQIAVGAIIFIGGIVLMLAGMWEFRRNNTIAATVFTAYGGFLAATGLIFLPGVGLFASPAAIFGPGAPGAFHLIRGLFFLCWTILSAVLLVGSLNTDRLFVSILGLLTVAYLFLTIGQLAGDSRPWLIIGGWIGIICALVAWFATMVSMTGTMNLQESLHLPAR